MEEKKAPFLRKGAFFFWQLLFWGCFQKNSKQKLIAFYSCNCWA